MGVLVLVLASEQPTDIVVVVFSQPVKSRSWVCVCVCVYTHLCGAGVCGCGASVCVNACERVYLWGWWGCCDRIETAESDQDKPLGSVVQ